MSTKNINFACPNGHPLSCGRELVGKAGKCPKCGAKFLVPEVPDEEPADSADATDAAKSSPAASATSGSSPATLASPAASTPAADMIVFLCPNGHRLNGPSRLAGKAGQCPHCNAKFMIPTLEEMSGDESTDESAEEEALVPRGKLASDSAVVGQDTLDELEEVEDFPEEEEAVSEFETEEDLIVPPSPPGSHPLSYVLARLWILEGAAGDVELFLADGEVVTPQLFARDLSYSGYGVFATDNGDGTYTVTTLPWEKIERIAFRKVKRLPTGLFQ